MDNKKYFKWLGCIGVVFAAICLFGCPAEQEPSQTNRIAPDFSLRTIDGEDIRLQNFRGEQFVHITFWATWCPACLMEIPKLIKLYQSIGNKPLTILAINVGVNDSVKKVRRLQDQYKMPYKILFDESGIVSQQYGIMGIPTHIVVNKNGQVLATFNQLPENPKDYFKQFLSS